MSPPTPRPPRSRRDRGSVLKQIKTWRGSAVCLGRIVLATRRGPCLAGASEPQRSSKWQLSTPMAQKVLAAGGRSEGLEQPWQRMCRKYLGRQRLRGAATGSCSSSRAFPSQFIPAGLGHRGSVWGKSSRAGGKGLCWHRESCWRCQSQGLRHSL